MIEEPIKEIKPIVEEPEKEIEPKENKQENNTEIIKQLPTWSIEPPIEINRGS